MKKLLITLIAAIFTLGGISQAENYTAEQQDAYDYAYSQKITTISSIEKANMNGQLTRIAMAKMLSNFAINVLGLQPDISKDCSFSDVSRSLDSDYDYGVTQACQLGLMGVGDNGKKSDNFNPYGTITRAQFTTAFSRALSQSNGKIIENGNPYYSTHLAYLQSEGIIKNTSTPSNIEKRGNVMIMMQRASTIKANRDDLISELKQYGTFNTYAFWSNEQVQDAEFQDNDGKRNGDYVSFYENGQVKEKGQYKNDKKTGEWIEYFEDGSVKFEGIYENGELEGYAVRYCEKGKEEEGYYKDGKCIRWEGDYKNGEYGGAMRDALKQYGTFNTYAFWSNEQVQSAEFQDNDGKRNGDYVSFYENGQIKEKGQYKDNEKTGEWIEYFHDGSIASKGSYKNGKLDGYWIRYCEKGDNRCTSLDGTYKDGKQVRGVEEYGTFNTYAYYSNKQIQSAEFQDNDGKRNGDYVSFYENGQIKEKGQYKDNEKTGEWIEYFHDGSIASKGSYKNGKLDGYAVRYCDKGEKGYYRDGKCISWEGNYENGEYIVD